jgi:hypothetical protein
VVQKLAQGLGLFGTLEGPVNVVRTFGALPKRLREPLLVEGVDGVAHRLGIAAHGAGDLVGILAPGACEKYLAERRKVKASGERNPASRVSRSASLKGRTKMGRFIPQMINLAYHLVWRCTSNRR